MHHRRRNHRRRRAWAAHETADRLAAAGIGQGHAVAVQLPNGPEIVTTMMGIWLAGAVFIPINARAPESEVASVLEATRPRAIVRGGELELLDDATNFEPGTAFATFTSGTTGDRKPSCTPTRRTSSCSTASSARCAAGRPTPMAQTQATVAEPHPGLAGAQRRHLQRAVRVARRRGDRDHGRFDTGDFAELVARFEIRSTVLPPAAITMLADDPAVIDLAPLRYVRSITAPLSPLQAPPVHREVRRRRAQRLRPGRDRRGHRLDRGRRASEHPEKLGALGRAHPGVDIKIVDDAGDEVGVDAVGELLVRPPSMAAGTPIGGDFAERLDADGFSTPAISHASTPTGSCGSKGAPAT